MSELFYCNWGGTDVQNTSPPGGEYAYDSVAGSTDFTKMTDGLGWNSDTNYLKLVTASASRYPQIQLSAIAGQTSGRFMFKVTSLGMNDTQSVSIHIIRNVSSASQHAIKLYNNAGTPEIQGFTRTGSSSGSFVQYGSNIAIELNKWYQCEIIYKTNTTSGASFKLWSENGATQIGSTQASNTVSSVDIELCRIGSMDAVANTNTLLFNRHHIWDDWTFPGPIVVAATGGDFKSTERGIMRGVGRRVVS